MKIITLVENTAGNAGCNCEHGLSLYVETEKHKLLMDTGASGLLLTNARALHVDLTQVDTVILSHGHYDHGGGILPFAGINPEAGIYLQETAFRSYYSVRDGKERYIGLDLSIRKLPQIIPIGAGTENTEKKGFLRIDDELSLFWDIGTQHPVPSGNRDLKIRSSKGLRQDDFRSEQCLVIRHKDRLYLLSGCAHHGILNILDRFRDLFGTAPDAVISGFHMMNKKGYSREDLDIISETAQKLLGYTNTLFYTCHCTGTEPYEIMHEIMGNQLRYIHCGDVVTA